MSTKKQMSTSQKGRKNEQFNMVQPHAARERIPNGHISHVFLSPQDIKYIPFSSFLPSATVNRVEYMYKCVHCKDICSSSSLGQNSTCDS